MNEGTLAGAVDVACSKHGDRPALRWSGQAASFAELRENAHRLASAYADVGIVPGDRIVCNLPNRPELLVAALAAWRLGAIHCGADPDLTPAEVVWRIEHSGAAALVTQPMHSGNDLTDLVRRVHGVLPRLPILVVGEAAGCLSFAELIEGSTQSVLAFEPGPADPALFLFTSGTTAKPKVVVRYHGQLLKGWERLGKAFDARVGDVQLAQLPLSHGFGFGLAVVTVLTGGTIVLMERFSPDEALRLITKHRVTVVPGTPVHFNLLTERVDPSQHDISSLRIGIGSAAKFPRHVVEGIFDRLGMAFLLLYGSSEGLGWSTTERQDMIRGSVGITDARSVRILAPDGALLPTGKIGEIALHKAHPVHYWQDDGSITDIDPGEWYFTGDLGRIEANGRLYVLGRVRHQVNRGGIRIDPGEVEAALDDHPTLPEGAVVGLPHLVLGEIVCLALVVKTAEPPDLAVFRSALAGVLAKHKLPEALCVVPEIPRTALGKIDRDALRSLAMASTSIQYLER